VLDQDFCPDCMALTRRHIETRQEVHEVRGVPIEVTAEVAVCVDGGHDIADPDLDQATLERAYAAYRRQYGILLPAQIREIRERTGLGQRAFGRLLGWGEITVHRYETGALPDLAHNTLLVVLQDESTLFSFMERRLPFLSLRDRRIVQEVMLARLPQEGAATVRRGLEQLIQVQPLQARGSRPFDLERVGQMVVFFAERLRPPLTKLNKLLWYADFLNFKRSSLSMSGLAYKRLPLGPVPDQYKLLFPEVENEGFVRGEPVTYGDHEGTDFEPLVPFDADLFSADERDVLEVVSQRLGPLTASQAVEMSHRERAWQETPPLAIVPYALAHSLSLD
jgi:putative zinc finger/helix-turn-helix YgiT family protein